MDFYEVKRELELVVNIITVCVFLPYSNTSFSEVEI